MDEERDGTIKKDQHFVKSSKKWAYKKNWALARFKKLPSHLADWNKSKINVLTVFCKVDFLTSTLIGSNRGRGNSHGLSWKRMFYGNSDRQFCVSQTPLYQRNHVHNKTNPSETRHCWILSNIFFCRKIEQIKVGIWFYISGH